MAKSSARTFRQPFQNAVSRDSEMLEFSRLRLVAVRRDRVVSRSTKSPERGEPVAQRSLISSRMRAPRESADQD